MNASYIDAITYNNFHENVSVKSEASQLVHTDHNTVTYTATKFNTALTRGFVTD